MRRTKIVCTIGPASRDEAVIEQLALAGMNVVRLNLSHGTHEQHLEVVERIRRVEQRVERPIAILMDLPGPKLRLGELAAPLFLRPGDHVELTTDALVGEGNVLPVEYPHFVDEVEPGDPVSLADGTISLVVTGKSGTRVQARAVSAGEVNSRKGVHLPEGGNGVGALTPRDEAALKLGAEAGVDWIALSFVRSAEDAGRAREILTSCGSDTPLVAKIERRAAVNAIDEIVAAFDGIMVARGDLGVEVPLPEVPGIQKRIIAKANRAAKPVITATQMLLSMVRAPRPTRAEVNDVANAILDGTDAVMLSEETAVGDWPAQAVEMMASIALHAEQIRPRVAPEYWELPLAVNEAIARASRKVAELVGATLIVTPTSSGSTSRLLAMCNPNVPVLALTNTPATVRRLCLTRGVRPVLVAETFRSSDQVFEICLREARRSGYVKAGDRVVVTAGFPVNTPGTTNLLQILEI